MLEYIDEIEDQRRMNRIWIIPDDDKGSPTATMFSGKRFFKFIVPRVFYIFESN